MSRNSKHHRKEKQLKRRKGSANLPTRIPRWVDVCHQATGLLKRRALGQARELLEEYDRSSPGQRDVLLLLMDVYHAQEDHGPFCQVGRRLLEVEPDNLGLYLMLAGGYWTTGRLASALRIFRAFIERWPDDPMADGVRTSIGQLEPAVEAMLRELSFQGDEGLECATLHEEAMACLEVGDFERTIGVGKLLLARRPDFVPAMNNVGEACFRMGEFEKAIAILRRALQQQPDGIHALANLSRYLVLTGQQHEAEELAGRLRSVQPKRDELRYKKIEALSVLGDDEAVLAVFEDAERSGAAEHETPANALLHHLAAVASARLGRDRQANLLWRQALEIQPGMQLARDNLDDASTPIAQRFGPYYFSSDYWFRKEALVGLREMEGLPRGKSDEAVAPLVRRIAEAYPESVRLVPALLDRGDRVGREFAWRLAMSLKTPELLDALRAFCLSQRGPDAMRVKTATRLARQGVLPTGLVRMWIEGRWQDVEVLGFRVTREPVGALHSPQVNDWAYEGMQAVARGDSATAESLFQKCIDLAGETPDLLNNLATAYFQQGRKAEAIRLAREIHERWPDYFFGCIALANWATIQGDLTRAEKFLAPLRRREFLHITEFTALATASIQLMIARREVTGTQVWLNLWREIDPGHPDLQRFELLCQAVDALRPLRNLFFKD